MMYRCQHFELQELVDPETFHRFGERAWMFLRPEAMMALDGVREFFGREVVVNNWAAGGPYRFRGFRPITCKQGSDYSQHRLGNAFDCDIVGVAESEIRRVILLNQEHPAFLPITRIEKDVSWLHIDCANVSDRIVLVSP
jgi:hypothetical protein